MGPASLDSWITVSREENTVTYTASANNTGAERTGTVVFGNATFSLTQPPESECPTAPGVSPMSLSFGSGGGSKDVTLNGENSCSYTVSDDQTWISVDESSVSGDGSVTVEVTENTSTDSRSGTVTIGGTSVSVTQDGVPCPAGPGVSPTSLSFESGGGAKTIKVDGPSACTFSVTADDWITVSPSEVSGGGTVNVSVPGNSDTTQQSGTVSIGTTSVSVTLDAACPSGPSVSPSSLSASGQISVSGSSTCHYDVSDDRDWISVSPSQVAGGGTVTVTVGGDPGQSGTVSIGTTSVSVSIPCPSSPTRVSPSSLSFESDAGSGTVDVSGSSSCSYSVSDNQDWISVSPSQVAGGGSVTVEVTANDGSSERSGTVTIGGSSVSVSQDGKPVECPSSPDVEPSSLSFGSGAGSKDVTLNGQNSCSYAVSGDQTWISVDESSVSGDGSVKVSVTENTSTASRSGTVTIGGSSVSVSQDGETVECPASPGVEPSSLSFESGGGAKTIEVDGPSACTFSVTADDWITVSPSEVSGGGTVNVSVPGNSGTTQQSGTVSIGTTSVSVTLEAACPSGPSVSPSSLSASGEISVSGSSTCYYDVSDDRDWISVSPSQVAGGGTVTVTVSGDPGQSGTVSIGTTSVSVSIPCPSSPTRVSPSSLSFGSDAGSGTVDVSGSSSCSYSVSDNQDWISVSPSQLAGGGSVTVDVTANDGSSERSGTVTIGGSSVSVTQCPSSPGVEPSSLSFGSGAGSGTVDVSGSSSCSYSVSDNQDWISVSGSSVAGGGSVTVEVTAHDGSSERSGTVTIGGSSVSVTQCPSSPGVEPSSLSLGSGANESDQVVVQEAATCSYTVTETLAWLRVEPTSVAGNGTVTFTTDTANDAASARTGTVTIGGTSVSVTQAGTDQPVNRPPVAVADTATTSPGTPVIVAVLANDTDPDGDALSVSAVVTAPAHGTAVVGADLQTVVYTPGPTRTGEDSFTYRVADGAGGTADATVTVTVQTSPNRPPTADAGPDQTAQVGARVRLIGTGSDPDVIDVRRLSFDWTQVSGPPVSLSRGPDPQDWTTFIAPATPGNAELTFSLTVTDPHGAASAPDTLVVTVLGQVLTDHRDRLLADYATRKGYGSNACVAWDSLHPTAQEVFVWNTHRLHLSDMLPDVRQLHAIQPRDGSECGGGEYNRTFMASTPDLQRKWVQVTLPETSPFPAWRKTKDLACSNAVDNIPFLPPRDCPHWPFLRQIETDDGYPRAQINFFGDDPFTQVEPVWRGTLLNPVFIDDYLMFEMDQDYNRFSLNPFKAIHASAPSCTGFQSRGREMKYLYADNYGDPGWDWEPSTCQPAGDVTVSESDQRTVGSAAGTFSATVTGPASSTWTAYSNVPWITILETTSDSRTGNGARSSRSPSAAETDAQEVRYEVAANTGTERTGTLRIAGKLVRIRQAGIRFNDDPIVAGSTPVRAIHILELRTRVDVLRQREGLTAFSWSDNTLVPEVTSITVAHLSDLRTALQAAYEAAERTVPTYTDPEIAPGAVAIRAVHLTELRAAVVALEEASR